MRQPNMTKKEQRKISILLSLAVIVTLAFVIYGQVKANEVEDLKTQLLEVLLENEQFKKEAEVQAEKAIEMAVIAKEAEANALMQKQIADKTMSELQECKKKINSS